MKDRDMNGNYCDVAKYHVYENVAKNNTQMGHNSSTGSLFGRKNGG